MTLTPRRAALILAALSCACAPSLPADTGEAPPAARAGARARASRPEITALQVGDGSGFTPEREVWVRLEAKSLAPITEVCLSLSARCGAWTPAADAYPLTLGSGPRPQIVRAWARDADGVISAVARAEVRLDARPPLDGSLTAAPVPGGVRLSWDAFSDAGVGIARYTVVGAPGRIIPYCSSAAPLHVESTAQDVTFDGLGPGTWSFSVCAVDRFGRSSLGASVRAEAGPDTTAPTLRGLTLAGGGRWVAQRPVDLLVDAEDDGALTGLCITEAETCAAWQPWTATPAHTLSGGGGDKTLRAWARDAWGNTAGPATLTVGLDNSPPSGGALTLYPLPGGASLRWEGVTDTQSGVATYTLRRALDRAPASCAEGEVVATTTATAFEDVGLISGQRYGYRLCAADAVGNLSTGLTGNVTPQAELDAPVVRSVRLAGGAPAVSDRYVQLEVDATDLSGVARMCLSNTPTCGTWRTYQASSMWTLDAGPAGARTVSVWVEDTLGNRTSTPTTATVRLSADADRDGYAEGWDCDDADPATFPGAPTRCGAEDRDCDGADDDDRDGDGLRAEACGGWDCDDGDPAANGSTCPQGIDCLDILEAGLSTGDGAYRVDPDGWGVGEPTSRVLCEMDAHGGGWTLAATNASSWSREQVVARTTFGTASLTAHYRGPPWFNQPFTDLMFEDGTTTAVYAGVGDGTETWADLQDRVPQPDCTRTSGLGWSMTAGNLGGGRLCDTRLYIHPHDQDGGGHCTTERLYSDYALGPAWSVSNNNGCPLDDPAGSSFASKGGAGWRSVLRMWIR